MSQASALEELGWKGKALAAIRAAAKTGNPFDAYTLTVNGLPDPPNANQWGRIFKTACGRGIIQPAGYGPSDRPSRRGGSCRLWCGTPDTGRFGVPATPSTGRTQTLQETE